MELNLNISLEVEQKSRGWRMKLKQLRCYIFGHLRPHEEVTGITFLRVRQYGICEVCGSDGEEIYIHHPGD